MSEIGEMYAAMKADYKALKARLGMPCPNCTVKLPKAQPKILLPQQTCWCGYKDERPRTKREGKINVK